MDQQIEDQAEKPQARKTPRKPDPERSILGGALVNAPAMRRKLGDISQPALLRLVTQGMPHVKKGSRLWFRPDAVLAWYLESERQLNQPNKKKEKA